MFEMQEPWEVYLDAEKYERTQELRLNRKEKPEDEYLESWEYEGGAYD